MCLINKVFQDVVFLHLLVYFSDKINISLWQWSGGAEGTGDYEGTNDSLPFIVTKKTGERRVCSGGSHKEGRETVSNSIRVLVVKNKAYTMLIVHCVGPVISHFSLAA